MSVQRKLHLTEEERQMYKSERLDNFRWISRIVASYSDVQLKDSDRVPAELCEQLSDIGQYSEIVYSTLPIADLLKHHDVLSRPGFPLEGYTALEGANLEGTVVGDVAELPAAVFCRPSHRQIIVSICGTKLAKQALQDVRVLKTRHPSGKGQVHTGFWSLYLGLRDKLKSCLREALRSHDAKEVVLTGHSMGGAIAYLLGIDILAEDKDPASPEQPLLRISASGSLNPGSGVTLKLVSFGMPRVGDEALVQYFHGLVDSYRERHGEERLLEHSVRTYNDGVPALPPISLGYRHFSRQPLYASGGNLYYIPSSERERTLFHIQDEMPEASESKPIRFPLGGHNYYGGRELERLQRRLVWLEKSDFFNGDQDWENRYLSMAQKHSAA